jgi:hypothetical protein
MRKRTASRYAGRYHQAPPTSRSRAADVSPPCLGEPDAVPRKSNIVQRLANPQPGAAGVSPPWVWKRFCTDTSAIVRQTAEGVCVCVDGRCIRVNRYHGGLTPRALAYRVPQTAGQRWWTSSAARFVSHGGLTPPALVCRVPQIGCRRWWASLAAGQVHSVARRAFQRFQASSRALRSAAGPFGSSPWRMKPWPAPG